MNLSEATVWERFVSGLDVELSCLRPEIAESWLRCRSKQVQPTLKRAPTGTDQFRSPMDEELTRVAGPVPALLNDALSSAGTLIVIANPNALVLLSAGGSRALDVAGQINALPGSLWVETTTGTNVLGTGILWLKPLELRWYEHYVEEWHKWACCSAPIFHPFYREPLGLLAIAGFRANAHPHAVDLAIRGADLISDSLRGVELQRRSVLEKTFDDFVRRYAGDGVLAIVIF